MSVLSEKVAYLKGLFEGAEFSEKDKETKIFRAIIDVLGELSGEVADLDERIDDVESVLDEVDEDLADLEDDYYGDDEEDEEDDFVELECPNCGETVYFDMNMLDSDDLVCPNCDTVICEAEEECGCGCHHHGAADDGDDEEDELKF